MTAVKEITEADLYHIFTVERRGDTLIVAPRGDATSFPEHHFRAAVQALRRRLDGSNPCQVIIDLSDLDYPGLAMLDVFDDLVEAMRWRGETVVVAGASDDTRRVLNEYGLGREWVHYPDLPAAIRDTVHEPFWKPLARHRGLTALAAVGALLLCGAALFLTSGPHPDRVAYEQLMEYWGEYQKIRQSIAEQPDLIAACRPLVEKVDAFTDRVVRRRRTPSVIEAAKHLQKMLHQPRINDDQRDYEMAVKMVDVRNDLINNRR